MRHNFGEGEKGDAFRSERRQGGMNPNTKYVKPGRLPDEVVELIAAELKVMAEPNCILLMELLNKGEATVQELSDQLLTTHQNVSKHLSVLYNAGSSLESGRYICEVQPHRLDRPVDRGKDRPQHR